MEIKSLCIALQLGVCSAIIEESTEKAIFSSSTLDAKHLPTGCRGRCPHRPLGGCRHPPLHVAFRDDPCYNTLNNVGDGFPIPKSEGFICIKFYLSAMAGFRRILKSPCVSKEIRFPKLNLPTVYQRNRRVKLAKINKHLSRLIQP